MKSEKQSSKTAKILYRPWGLVASLLGGLIAGQIFQQVWKRLDPESLRTHPSRSNRSTGYARSSSPPSSKAPSSGRASSHQPRRGPRLPALDRGMARRLRREETHASSGAAQCLVPSKGCRLWEIWSSALSRSE